MEMFFVVQCSYKTFRLKTFKKLETRRNATSTFVSPELYYIVLQSANPFAIDLPTRYLYLLFLSVKRDQIEKSHKPPHPLCMYSPAKSAQICISYVPMAKNAFDSVCVTEKCKKLVYYILLYCLVYFFYFFGGSIKMGIRITRLFLQQYQFWKLQILRIFFSPMKFIGQTSCVNCLPSVTQYYGNGIFGIY